MKKYLLTFFAAIFMIIWFSAFANKTSVKVLVPDKIKMGDQITITINVIHKGNTPGHFTDWVYLKINGKEVKRWTYTKTSLPPGGNFTLTYTHKVTENSLNIEAEGDCSIHGTTGAFKIAPKVQP
jgi:desulfoferrodoxin (superoxide reductase-like protein)